MIKVINMVKDKFCFLIKVLFLWLRRHKLSIQMVMALCSIICFSYLFFIWYRVPHRTVTYTIKTYGCIGYPKCKILVNMNYGYKDIPKDTLGCSIKILHPFQRNSPYLFKGFKLSSHTPRVKEYYKEYEPLCYKYPSSIDSISTLYKSIVSQEADFYDEIKSKDDEYWSNSREILIYKHPTQIKNKKVIENETCFYLKRYTGIDTIHIFQKLCSSFDCPKWFSKGDVSKLDCEIKFETYNLVECDEINIRFNGPYSLYSKNIEPDKDGYDYISYTSPFKLEVIHQKGLKFCALFPMFERMQQTRIAVLMIIIPILLSWLLYILRKMVMICLSP